MIKLFEHEWKRHQNGPHQISRWTAGSDLRLVDGFIALVWITMFCTFGSIGVRAESTSIDMPTDKAKSRTESTKKHHVKRAEHKSNGIRKPVGVDSQKEASSTTSVEAATAARLARFDKLYGLKGWSIPFPSMSDSLLQDYGGVRSALDSAGFGFLAFSVTNFTTNMLNTPTKVPANYPTCSKTSGAVCAGSQTYFGQRPSYYNGTFAYLTYDMSRWGIPDGQIQVAANWFASSDEQYFPRSLQVSGLAWYQTLWDQKIDIRAGYFSADADFIGLFVGGNFANTFGVSASIPIELGLSYSPTQSPMARTTFHMTDNLYNEFGVARSLPVNGPTGNAVYDEAKANPSGMRFSMPGSGVLLINELGYKNAAAPGEMQNWIRFGAMYNSSNFRDYTRLSDASATIKGNGGFYFLADRQLWQQAPGSPLSAYRGIYGGVSAMYAPPQETAFSQYYEGRLYWMGPFDSRPTDMVSFVYAHNVMSHYLADQLDQQTAPLAALGVPVPLAYHASNSYTLSYLAHLTQGVYLGIGTTYTDHASLQYFQGQGGALNFLATLTTIF